MTHFKKLYTNKGYIDDDQIMHVERFQDAECNLCSCNLCKGEVLQNHVDQIQNQIEKIVYVGDGSNDFCPVLKLKNSDFACIRQGYTLDRMVKEYQKNNTLKTNCLFWESGQQITQLLKSIQ